MSATLQQTAPILKVQGLAKRFPMPRERLFGPRPMLTAVADVSFDLAAGETLAVVGESGCGKSTVGNLVLNLLKPSAGVIAFEGEDLSRANASRWRARRQDLQLVFQDSRGALDPRLTIDRQVAEGLEIHRMGAPSERLERARHMLGAVGLGGNLMGRYPHELSGGQQQRAVIARALVLEPKLMVCDEPVEVASRDALFSKPAHPYSRALIGAVPAARSRHGRRVQPVALHGEPPSPLFPPQGCALNPRCPFATDLCRQERPDLRPLPGGGFVACHHAENLT